VYTVLSAQVPVSPDTPAERIDIADLPPDTIDCFLQLDASGEIWSGVIFTGNTPPAGWDMLALELDSPFPYHGHPDAHRYSLIGRWEYPEGGTGSNDWFYVGAGRTLQVVRDGNYAHDPTGLWLAVNRPDPMTQDPHGSGSWEVSARILGTDASDRPMNCAAMPPPNAACMSSTGRLSSLHTTADQSCTTVRAETRRVNADTTAFWALIIALGVDLTIIGGLVGVAIGGANTLESTVRGALITSTTGPTGGWIAATGVAAVHFTEAAAAGTAQASGLGPGGWIFLGILIAIGVGILIALLVLAVDMENGNAGVRNAQTTFDSAVGAIRSELLRTAMFCCPGSFDTSIPTCM
jgi:hypothetical protein